MELVNPKQEQYAIVALLPPFMQSFDPISTSSHGIGQAPKVHRQNCPGISLQKVAPLQSHSCTKCPFQQAGKKKRSCAGASGVRDPQGQHNTWSCLESRFSSVGGWQL
eukprot:1158541-Pelagomonas_calceolata.AAC.4